MLFNSFEFLFLVIITFILYYIPFFKKSQVMLLIIASFVFYAWYLPILTLLLFFSGTINALFSHLVFDRNTGQKLYWATAGVAVNLLILAFFKYNRLIAETIAGNLEQVGSGGSFILAIPLPIGISFFTFQGISLVVDVYRASGKNIDLDYIKRNRFHHWYHSLFYLSFFAQLVAGPIVKAHDFMPQIQRKYLSEIDWEKAVKVLIIGYFLKMVIADNLKDYTYWITYPYFQNLSSIYLISLLFGFSMQIFADFAGYSMIAVGIGELFGYQLPVNFNFPYISRSFSEFWQRWHISLSMWLKEYLYFPLGGNRKGKIRIYINLFIVMFLGGLWHGASWSYAVWGTFHGILLAVERFFSKRKEPVDGNGFMTFFKISVVFISVTLAWLLFRLSDFEHVILYMKAISNNWSKDINETELFHIFIFSIPIVLYHMLYVFKDRFGFRTVKKNEGMIYAVLLFLIISNSGGQTEFIYFQF